jgi:hypothetical protein
MKRKRLHRRHSAKASLRVHELTKAGTSLNLKIYADMQKIGELEIGRGALYWFGRNRKTRKRIPWSKFSEMMDGLAYGA